ncbi:hypothetical protein NCCP2716_26050 [Sporosarcina sp. NCCP-2716]|uniref:hypothetical protein n=1 Tax=Sporosarcina sp. NCCP-2716 TaxID=2943679 RepID=UPI0020423543|nr:hypothetical protein [Sporosarcina sp. NCCP-2716]GKV70107.1 hypothetical protein NCCP2716_26050 [Sporosarcina sp. NCCP-2716]
MPQTTSGKITAALLVLFFIQVIIGCIYLFTAPLMVFTVILATSLIAGIVFLVGGTIGTVFEDGSRKAVPLIVAALGAAELVLFLSVQFGFSFGG